MTITDNRTRWLALIVLCLGTLMIVLDTTIVNVALPSIRTDLGFSQTSLAWVVNAYLLTFGGFLLLGGRLGDLYGHRRLFLVGHRALHARVALLRARRHAGPARAARAVQGLGGAVASAVSLSLMMTLFTEPAERAKAMGIFGFVASGGGAIGVLLGGVLTNSLDWHWIFLVNLPIGVAVVFLSLRLLPGGRAERGNGRLDVAGAVTVTAALMLAVYAIVNGNNAGWTSAQTLGLPRRRGRALRGSSSSSSRASARRSMPLGLFARAQPRDRERRRRALGRGDVRLVLPVGALPAARARLQPAAGRARVPAGQPDHGRALARRLGEARDALRHQAPARRRARARGRRARCCSRARPSAAASSSTCCRA